MRVLLICLTAALLLSACGGNTGSDLQPEFPAAATHELKNVFRVSEPDSGLFLNSVQQMRFLSDGNFLFRNGYSATRLLEMSPDGSFQGFLGRQGRGPGEFIHLTGVVTDPWDSVYVYDRRNGRQQVFSRRDAGGWQLARVDPFKPDLSRELIPDYPMELFPSDEHAYLGLFRNNISFDDTTTRFYEFVAGVDQNLELTGEIQMLRLAQDAAVYREGAGVSTDWDDEYRRGFYLFRPETSEVVYVTNTSNEIRILRPDGEHRTAGYLPYERRANDLGEINRRLRTLSDTYDAERVERIRDKYLETEPYYLNMYLDGDRLWIRFSRSDSTAPDWAVTGLDGQVQALFRSPVNFQPLAADRGRLYGVQTLEEVPHLAAFIISEEH